MMPDVFLRKQSTFKHVSVLDRCNCTIATTFCLTTITYFEPQQMNQLSTQAPVKYYPALDGLRGYAALMVLFYHAQLIAWGWIGVNIFFVLSGFLITRNLLQSKGNPGYYKSFFIKRITRVFPIYYLMLFSTIAWSFYRNASNADAWMYILLVQNFKLGLHNIVTDFSNWFDHTWTLAVEEQFYLLFPFIVANFNNRAFKMVCMLLITAGTIATITIPLIYGSNLLNIFNTISCMPFLCGGALLANAGAKEGKRISVRLLVISTVVLAGLFIAVYFTMLPGSIQSSHTQEGQAYFITAIPLLIFAIQFLVNNRNTITTLLFENKIIIYVGKISYGLYLYHFPVFMLCFAHKLPVIASFAITFCLAALSWHFVEKPILSLRNR